MPHCCKFEAIHRSRISYMLGRVDNVTYLKYVDGPLVCTLLCQSSLQYIRELGCLNLLLYQSENQK